ncbi:MAG TPA: Gfo/Idh/MocA family oxidoreductase [Candidatus Methylacidiphilales bacterium]|jgi:predicted dehydrogenase|nr:Gfo/Idh/MocA family oxidoreductase [Candidatus Methylacidiphilales bacterium]
MNVSPHRPLSLAVVGLAFGRHILGSLRYPPASNLFKLTAVSDLRENVASEVGAEFGVNSYTSLEKMLQDEDIDVVGLYTQPSGRAKLLREILRAGKDVMTTKPFELDAEEAEDVLREAQSLGRVIHLNSPSPELTLDLFQIQTWAHEHELGRLVSARGEVWAPYREKADGSWMDNPMLCPGGSMMRFGIYLMNDIIHLAGPVENVNLISSRIRTGRPTPDNALLTMSFGSGCLASIFTSFCVDDGDRYSNGLTLNYERGTIYRNVGPANGPAKSDYSNLALVMREGEKRQLVAEKSFNEYSGVYQWQALHRAITEGESISDGYIQRIVEGVKVLEAMRGAAVSA